jgi:hypothetical protein
MVGCSIIVVFVLTKVEPSHHYFLLISGGTNRCCALWAVFDDISVWDKKLFLRYLINTAIRLWINGHVPMLTEIWELYKKGIDGKLLTQYGRITVKTYSNIVTTGNSLLQFDFVLDFVEKYTDNLEPGFRDDGKAWATAHTLCKRKDFEQCIALLSTHKFEDQIFTILGKVVLLEAYYEAYQRNASYFSFMADFSEAFKKYIQREKLLSEARKTALLNFIKYTFLLVKNLEEKKLTPKQLASIEEMINKETHIQGKQWLFEKIKELTHARLA